MTNYECIKNMSAEEMSDFFANMFDCNLCSEHERLSDNPLLSNETCDNDCINHCKQWLEMEAEE